MITLILHKHSSIKMFQKENHYQTYFENNNATMIHQSIDGETVRTTFSDIG
jgi:hypothetical protein